MSSPTATVRRTRRRALGALLGAGVMVCRPRETPGEEFPRRRDLDADYTADVDEAIREGLAFLITRQKPDGTFQSPDQGRWVGVCALVGLAFLSRGLHVGLGEAGEALRRTADYIISRVQSSGFISANEATSHGPMYDHGFGTLFLAELYGEDPDPELRAKLAAAVKLIARTQNNQGGWRYHPKPDEADLSVTVCQMMALRAARNAGIGVNKQTIDRAVDYVRRSQNADGGFMYRVTGGPSTFPLTAAAVVALYSAGIYQGSEIDAALRYLRTRAESHNSLEREKFYYYAHYYSAQAFWYQGGAAWTSWYGALKKTVLGLRNPRGGWFDYNSVEYGTAMACLILNMPRTVLPIFQR